MENLTDDLASHNVPDLNQGIERSEGTPSWDHIKTESSDLPAEEPGSEKNQEVIDHPIEDQILDKDNKTITSITPDPQKNTLNDTSKRVLSYQDYFNTSYPR